MNVEQLIEFRKQVVAEHEAQLAAIDHLLELFEGPIRERAGTVFLGKGTSVPAKTGRSATGATRQKKILDLKAMPARVVGNDKPMNLSRAIRELVPSRGVTFSPPELKERILKRYPHLEKPAASLSVYLIDMANRGELSRHGHGRDVKYTVQGILTEAEARMRAGRPKGTSAPAKADYEERKKALGLRERKSWGPTTFNFFKTKPQTQRANENGNDRSSF